MKIILDRIPVVMLMAPRVVMSVPNSSSFLAVLRKLYFLSISVFIFFTLVVEAVLD